MKLIVRLSALLLMLMSLSGIVQAQEHHPVTVELRSFFYGDNTEFFNPYRDGETLLGEQLRLSASMTVAKNVRIKLGAQSDGRAGGTPAFDSVVPIVSLEVGGPRNVFVMGTLRSGALDREPAQDLWPDVSGPHGLVPPLHLDTLTMTQPNDAGLQWLHTDRALISDIWIAWRQVCTATQREKFDVGLNSRLNILRGSHGLIGIAAQGHILHQGGQLTHVDMVGDSDAGGFGPQGELRIGSGLLRADAFMLYSKHNPDRGDLTRPDRLNGHGTFLRTAYELRDWRGAWLVWRGTDFIQWNGDPNYGAVLNDGQQPIPNVTRAARTYQEFSLSRRFRIGNDVAFMANGRYYKVDDRWDYAYRVVASIRFRRTFGGEGR